MFSASVEALLRCRMTPMASEKPPADDDSQTAGADRPPTRRMQPGAAGLARGADGRRSGETLKRNQERLGVGPDHRTEAMKKGKRGTFP
jgi:hypothetical protein